MQTASKEARETTRTSLERFTWNTGFRAVFDILCGGTTFVFVAFLRNLGIEREQMGWVTGIISVACILQVAGVPLGRRFMNRKRLILNLLTAEPLFFTVAVLFSLVAPPALRLPLLAFAIFMAAVSVNLARPHFDEWMASVMPAGIRGRYIGRRLQVNSIVMIAATLAAGWLVDHMGRDNTLGLAMLLAAGGICGFLSVSVLSRATLPAISAATTSSLAAFRTALSTPAFLRCMLVITLFNLPFYFACPYYQVFNLEVVGMPAMMIGIMQSGYYLVKIAALHWIRRHVDRWNPIRVLLVSGIMYTAFFAVYPFVHTGRYWPLLVAWAVVSMADAIFGLASQIVLYQSIPNVPSRQAYFALFSVATMVFYGIGGSLAVPLLNALKPVQWQIGGLTLGSFHLYYAGCAVMMACTTFSAYALRTGRPEARPPSV
ncbi:MAG: hypothetical protein A2498_14510 [Lentisphaerae bacterium RIFOXYC12_FULL_60_16]|nr:MAG: hypothetical protein A2498_14510 [Lentisphaerae bacterium RIFOXYC12_FULL_60_16]OGV71859.1 MAG: hypothetical protein A2269_08575 [Lentisphaerae bacterium RIFOXYA12_FULL_60_10]OGV86654.1 MAG: hypothetical protein A2340_02080 [Lentisphaerae bacterium RIFOXYB12_FULL_60_10]